MEGLALTSFSVEPLDHLDPEELLDDRAVREREVLLGLGMAELDRASEEPIGDELQREDDDRRERESDIDHADHADQDLELEQVEHEKRELLLNESLDLVGVVHDAGADASGLVGAIELQAQLLEMIEQAPTHREADVLTHPQREHPARIEQRVAGDVTQEQPKQDQPEQLPCPPE